MSTENTQLAERPASVKDYLALPAYKDRFIEVLRSRAPQFMAAITAVSNSPALKDAEPRSVIAAAMVAATLDLPVNPTLGQAHIVAYGDGQGNKVAQFQIGYKGLIQLALRSGQYKRLNAAPVSAGVFVGFDLVGEPILDFTKNDPVAETAGYYCAFETLNGFIKVVYWSKNQAEAHGKRFSKAYAKGYSTPWKSDFDSMAVKTVIKAALGKWGILSVEMQKAVVHDQGAQEDVDADVKYVDGGEDKDAVADDSPKSARPPAPKRAAKGAATVVENQTPAKDPTIIDAETTPVQEVPKAVEQAPAEPAAAPAPTVQPRAFLKDGEEFTANCEVAAADGMIINKTVDGAKVPFPSVQVKLKGDYTGIAYHIDGGEKAGADVKPKPVWAVGAAVKVKLRGKANAKSVVQVFVEAVEALAAEMEA